MENSPKLDTFLTEVTKLKDPEAQKFKSKYGDIDTYAENINSNDDTYFFINVLQNKRDEGYTRGSVVKAMSLASKYRYVESFYNILDQALNEYFEIFSVGDNEKEILSKAEQVMSKIYTLINSE